MNVNRTQGLETLLVQVEGKPAAMVALARLMGKRESVLYPFDRPLETTPGQPLTICGRHDRGALRIWVDRAR